MKGTMLSVDELLVKLKEIDLKISNACQGAEGDLKSSPILKALTNELQEKSQKTLSAMENGDEESIHEHIIELEEAADCAKVGAQADLNISNSTRQIIFDAHAALCHLKAQLLRS
jgi:hypothetical protein